MSPRVVLFCSTWKHCISGSCDLNSNLLRVTSRLVFSLPNTPIAAVTFCNPWQKQGFRDDKVLINWVSGTTSFHYEWRPSMDWLKKSLWECWGGEGYGLKAFFLSWTKQPRTSCTWSLANQSYLMYLAASSRVKVVLKLTSFWKLMGAIKMSVLKTLKNCTEVFLHNYSCNGHISQLSDMTL